MSTTYVAIYPSSIGLARPYTRRAARLKHRVHAAMGRAIL